MGFWDDIRNRLGGFGDRIHDIFNPRDYTGEMEGVVNTQQQNYQRYINAAMKGLQNPPQINLNPYIQQLNDYRTQLLGRGNTYANELQNIYGQTRGDVTGYQRDATGFSESMLEEYLRSAGRIDELGQTSLDKSMGSYDEYLQQMNYLATEEMPGMDIAKQDLGAQTSSSLQRLQDIGGANASSVASLLGGETQQLRNLAVESSKYKADRRVGAAEAQANYGQMVQGAYNSAIGASATAAGLRGQGYDASIGTALNNAGLSAQLGNMGLNATMGSYDIINSAYTGAAGMTNSAAGLAQNQFNFNQFMPYQMQNQLFQNLALNNNPAEMQMSLLGNLYEQQMMKNYWMANLPGQIQGQAQNSVGSLLPLMGK